MIGLLFVSLYGVRQWGCAYRGIRLACVLGRVLAVLMVMEDNKTKGVMGTREYPKRWSSLVAPSSDRENNPADVVAISLSSDTASEECRVICL